MSGDNTDSTGGKGGGPLIVTAATSTTAGVVTLPFTSGNHTVSIVGLLAIVLGVVVVVAHFGLRFAGLVVSRRK